MEKLETDTVFTTATHPAALPEGKTEEEAVAIYDNYDFNYEYNSALSITRYRQEVRQSSVHRAGKLWSKISEIVKWMPNCFFIFFQKRERERRGIYFAT